MAAKILVLKGIDHIDENSAFCLRMLTSEGSAIKSARIIRWKWWYQVEKRGPFFSRAYDISTVFLRRDFISSRESYLVCNGSIAILQKSFKLTSRADSYPPKWPTEAKNYQKIKRDVSQCEVEMGQKWAEG